MLAGGFQGKMGEVEGLMLNGNIKRWMFQKPSGTKGNQMSQDAEKLRRGICDVPLCVKEGTLTLN